MQYAYQNTVGICCRKVNAHRLIQDKHFIKSIASSEGLQNVKRWKVKSL